MKVNPHSNVYLDELTPDAPVPASGGGATPPAPSSDVDWVDESSPIDDSVPAEPVPSAPSTTPTLTPAAPAPSTPAAPAAPVTPAPATAAPVPATATPAPTVPVVPAPLAVAPVAPAPSAPVDLAAMRTAEVTRLTGQYSSGFTEDVARGLLVEPEKHLPAILANLQVNTMEMVIQHMYASLPQLIQTMTQQSSEAERAENEFYKQWPALKTQESYKPVVENAIRTYRALNKGATRDESIRAAGLAAMITLRLPLPQELFAPQPPAAPVVPAPTFAHAAPSAATPTPPAARPLSAFQLLN
jgi:hypothetical protein